MSSEPRLCLFHQTVLASAVQHHHVHPEWVANAAANIARCCRACIHRDDPQQAREDAGRRPTDTPIPRDAT